MNIKFNDFIQKIKLLLYPYLILLVISVLLMMIYSKEDLYFSVNRVHTAYADVFFTYITQFGSGLGCIVIALSFMLINFRKGFLLATSYMITFIISQMIKHWVQAPRPHLFFAEKLHDIYLIKGVVMLDTNSFPSGHSVSAFSAAVVLTYTSKSKSSGILLLLIAVLIAYSRMYLSEHFLEDVVAGSALGVLITIIWLKVIDRQTFLQSKSWNKGIFNKISK